MSIFAIAVGRQINVRPPSAESFSTIVAKYDADLVSHWPFANTGTDLEGVQNATITGNPELNIETIVDLNEGGVCIAWPGTVGEYAEIPHNAAHKVAEGTFLIYHQPDVLSEKVILLCGDVGTAAGGFSCEINADGSHRCFIRDTGAVPIVLTGQPGDIVAGNAYATFLKWGSAGLSISTWDADGNLVRRSENPTMTGGLTASSSAIRFGAWHTDVSHFDGPYGPVLMFDRRLTNEEEEELALARTIEHEQGEEPPPPVLTDAPFFGLAFGDDTASPNPSNSRLTASNTAGHSDFFWAERTGTVSHFRAQFRANGDTGQYSKGDGGIYTIEIRKANMNTKLPLTGASDLICQYNNHNADVNNTQWLQAEFTTKGQTIKGDPYCFVYRNTHANPGANYVSENRSIRYGDQPGDGDVPPPGGWTPIVLPAGLTGAGRPHKPFPTFTRNPPTLELGRIGPGHWNIRYSDGQWTGTGHLGQLSTPERHVVSGTNMVRHRFRPWRTHVATGVSICIQRRNASGGSVVLTLESGPASLSSGNGTQIEQVSIPASALFNIGANQVFDFHNQKVWWNTVNFSQNRTLNAGTIYTIRVSASGGLDGSFNAGYRAEHSGMNFSEPFDDFDQYEANQKLSWDSWEYSLGLQISTNSGTTWSFPTGNNRQTCPLLIRCQP